MTLFYEITINHSYALTSRIEWRDEPYEFRFLVHGKDGWSAISEPLKATIYSPERFKTVSLAAPDYAEPDEPVTLSWSIDTSEFEDLIYWSLTICNDLTG